MGAVGRLLGEGSVEWLVKIFSGSIAGILRGGLIEHFGGFTRWLVEGSDGRKPDQSVLGHLTAFICVGSTV